MSILFILFQVIFGIILATFILFPQIKPPFYAVQYINSIVGIVVSLVFIFVVFAYANPILGILSIFACYLLYLRANEKIARVQQTQENTNIELHQMNNATPKVVDSLEEYIVGIMAPIDAPPMNDYYYTQFKPVNTAIGTASML